jgi:hypothetical protein
MVPPSIPAHDPRHPIRVERDAMTTTVQGRAWPCSTASPSRLAGSPETAQPIEKLLYSGSRSGFRLASERAAKQARGPRQADPDGLFDLSSPQNNGCWWTCSKVSPPRCCARPPMMPTPRRLPAALLNQR